MNEVGPVLRLATDLNCRVVVKTRLGNGMPIQVVWTDSVGKEISKHGYFESETVALLPSLTRSGSSFIDIGAHVGQYTLLAAAAGCLVHSFEPDRMTFSILAGNVKMNRLERLVRINNCAVGAVNGAVPFYLANPLNIGTSGLKPPEDFSGEPTPIRCVTLDKYALEANIKDVCGIKIDVEGAELDVLYGASETISRFKPPIIVELSLIRLRQWGRTAAELIEWFAERKYRLFRAEPKAMIPYFPSFNEADLCNLLAYPNELS